ncbi:hypothetical protein [Bradyrhizobium zhanjiangense]|uniref:Uncharacterized protein n=1 Tax=Bradyrhizobium zhanjiangense TaxID=1325107 RepID=A0A4Q0SN95_9BRAD|nr:hypothetical protein [Bradyrhizobium zhanjiangense]RXH41305.1 hypothetical protein XH94_08970 [Bradyrhizobium zhanjiangense]
MFAPLKYLVLIAGTFLLVFGILPIGVSAVYGGNPPPHLARLLDKQMDTFSTAAILFFRALTRSNEEKSKDDQGG